MRPSYFSSCARNCDLSKKACEELVLRNVEGMLEEDKTEMIESWNVCSPFIESSFLDTALRQLINPEARLLCGEVTLPLYKLVSASRTFFNFIDVKFPNERKLSVSSLEKMANISFNETDSDLCWHNLVDFIRSVLHWRIVQSVYLSILRKACGLSEEELVWLCKRFSDYDSNLENCIPSEDLLLLLQDMDGDYDEDEIAVICSEIDPMGAGTVSFESFLFWWSGA